MSVNDASLPGSGASGEPQELESPSGRDDAGDAATDDSQEDFVHESVDLPDWVPVVFGLILIVIAAAAIWMAAGA